MPGMKKTRIKSKSDANFGSFLILLTRVHAPPVGLEPTAL